MADVKANALKATQKYKGKYIQVSGVLTNIESSGRYLVIEQPAEHEFDIQMHHINCYIKNEQQKNKVLNMNIGDTITVKGKCRDVGEIVGYYIDLDDVSK